MLLIVIDIDFLLVEQFRIPLDNLHHPPNGFILLEPQLDDVRIPQPNIQVLVELVDPVYLYDGDDLHVAGEFGETLQDPQVGTDGYLLKHGVFRQLGLGEIILE